MENKVITLIKSKNLDIKKASDYFSLDFYEEMHKRFNEDDYLLFSISGLAFAVDGGGGEYSLLDDNSVGYSGPDGECGRVAESISDFLELMVGCRSWWNMARWDYVNDSEALKEAINVQRNEDKESFMDFYGDEYDDYDELQLEISNSLNICDFVGREFEILNKFYKSTMRSLEYYWIARNNERSSALMRKFKK